MKVILSIEPIKYPLTGIGRYTLELAQHLAADTRVESLRFFSGAGFVDAIPTLSVLPPATFRLRHHLLKSRAVVAAFRFASGVRKRRALTGHGDYIFHGPNFYLPSFDGAAVATFHDLSMYRWAHCHPPERVRYMERELELSLRRASMLITDSEFTRREIAEFFAWPADRIRAIPLAPSVEFYPRAPTATQMLLSRFGLAYGEFTLFSGTIEPRKNLCVLLDAYASLPLGLRRRWPLVLCGYQGWKSEDLMARIETATRAGWVKYLGYLSAEELPLLFASARLFAFPSLYEGFGLPVIEAMASGVPVVCSNAASLPEVAGDAAAMCHPLDVDGLGGLIARGLSDNTWRNSAIERGLERAAEYSWRTCATRTVDLYRYMQAGPK